MAKHRLSLPPSAWPEDIRDHFDRYELSAAQRTRLGRALGRWLKIADNLGADARDVTREAWLERTAGLPRHVRNEVRQALAIVFPMVAAELYAKDNHRKERANLRDQLSVTVARNLARFPDDWRAAAMPLLHVDEVGLGDGILVQAWAPSTIKRRLDAASLYFDFCRARGLPVDIIPSSIRAKLREDQARVERGERRLGGVAVDTGSLAGFAAAVRPDRSWAWLMTTRNTLNKLASHHGSRNAARAIDAAELRAAGLQLLDKADAHHGVARNRREMVAAHTKARTALLMILLAEAPIRITSCAELDLGNGLLVDLTGLFLDASRTKEGDIDRRAFSATLIDAICRYLRVHRAVVAAPEETRLLVGERGGPIKAAQLSKNIGDFTGPVFGVRVTPHAIRHSVGNFIVATAPEEAALASIILNHRSDAVTPDYHQRANQIVASRKLRDAVESSAAALSVDTSPTRRAEVRLKRAPRQRARVLAEKSHARSQRKLRT